MITDFGKSISPLYDGLRYIRQNQFAVLVKYLDGDIDNAIIVITGGDFGDTSLSGQRVSGKNRLEPLDFCGFFEKTVLY